MSSWPMMSRFFANASNRWPSAYTYRTMYQPLDINKKEIRVLRPCNKNDEFESPVRSDVESGKSLISLKMITVSLLDYSSQYRDLTREKSLDIYEGKQLFREKVFGDLAIPKVFTDAENYSEHKAKVEEASWQEPESETFGRWTWGDYVALSYTWGDASQTISVLVNGQITQVTQNLWDCLYVELSTTTTEQPAARLWLWIDALCINQSDLDEKSAQIKRMGDIYSHALSCNVWLGTASEDSDAAIEILKELGERFEINGAPIEDLALTPENDIAVGKIQSKFGENSSKALLSLLNRSYWKRLWIIQEIVLSRGFGYVVCGAAAISLTQLFLASARLGYEGMMVESEIYQHWNITDNNRLPHISTLCFDEPPAGIDIYKLLRLCRTAEQTDARDKVYGLMNLVSPEISRLIIPDYRLSTEDVFIGFTKAVIKGTKSLDILCHSTPHNADKLSIATQNLELPTWVLDLRRHPTTTMDLTPSNLPFNAGGKGRDFIEFGDSPPNSLKFRGFVFDKIDGLGQPDYIFKDLMLDIIQPQYKDNAYATVSSTRAAVSRSMLANRPLEGLTDLEESFDLFDGGWIDSDSVHSENLLLPQLMQMDIQNANEKFLVGGRQFRSYYDAPNTETQGLSRTRFSEISRAAALSEGRRLMTTKRGYIGLTVRGARQGDIIAIAFGSGLPLVLRPNVDGNHYSYVGEAYVHGIMEGEMIEPAARGEFSEMEFVIL